MGDRRAGDRALGLVAVTRGGSLMLLLVAVGLLDGCRGAAEIGGVVAGAVAGGSSGNPAVGFAVGVGVDAAGLYVGHWIGRTRQHAEQQAIANAAADVIVGGRAPWKIVHTIPIDNEHGEVWVVREFATPLATCKEIVFSVIDGKKPDSKRSWYDTTICRDPKRWEWAEAEPAVPRWGFLQ